MTQRATLTQNAAHNNLPAICNCILQKKLLHCKPVDGKLLWQQCVTWDVCRPVCVWWNEVCCVYKTWAYISKFSFCFQRVKKSQKYWNEAQNMKVHLMFQKTTFISLFQTRRKSDFPLYFRLPSCFSACPSLMFFSDVQGHKSSVPIKEHTLNLQPLFNLN